MPRAALVLSFLLAGCVMSIEPAVPVSETVFEPRLLGTWESFADETTRVVITWSAEDRYYVIDQTDQEGKLGGFRARVAREGNRLLFDIRPATATLHDLGVSEGYTGMLVPGHVVLVLEIGADEIRSQVLEVDSVRAALSDGRLYSPHLDLRASMAGEKGRYDVLLTGTTPQVRAVLGQALSLPGALVPFATWRRAAR